MVKLGNKLKNGIHGTYLLYKRNCSTSVCLILSIMIIIDLINRRLYLLFLFVCVLLFFLSVTSEQLWCLFLWLFRCLLSTVCKMLFIFFSPFGISECLIPLGYFGCQPHNEIGICHQTALWKMKYPRPTNMLCFQHCILCVNHWYY